MAKIKFYTLNGKASMFYDPKSKLKVTPGIPGSTSLTKSKGVVKAVQGGHIKEVTEDEYKKMMRGLPEGTQKAVGFLDKDGKEKEKEKAPKAEKKKEEPKDERTEDELLEVLSDYDLGRKDKKKVAEMNLEELRTYVQDLEKG